jgi:hypothetical protein
MTLKEAIDTPQQRSEEASLDVGTTPETLPPPPPAHEERLNPAQDSAAITAIENEISRHAPIRLDSRSDLELREALATIPFFRELPAFKSWDTFLELHRFDDRTPIHTDDLKALVELSETVAHHESICVLGLSHVTGADSLKRIERACDDLLQDARRRIEALKCTPDESGGLAAELQQKLIDSLNSRLHLNHAAFEHAPRRFLPEYLSDLAAGDVVQLRSGTRVLIHNQHSLSALTVNGRVGQYNGNLEEAFSQNTVEHVERGHGVSLHRGVECALYVPYAAIEYFKPGDILYGSSLQRVEVANEPSGYRKGQCITYRRDQDNVLGTGNQFEHDMTEAVKDSFFFSERQDLALSPPKLLEHLRNFKELQLQATLKQSAAATTKHELHPIHQLLDDTMKELELLAADHLQQHSDRWIQWRFATESPPPATTSADLNPMLVELQKLKICRLGLGSQISGLSDYSMLSAQDIKDLVPNDVHPPLAHGIYYNWRKVENLHYLECLVKSLKNDTLRRGNLGPQEAEEVELGFQHALAIVREVGRCFDNIENGVRAWEERTVQQAEEGKKLERWGFTRWEGLKHAFPYEELRALASTVPWSRSAEEAQTTGAVFHYDPRIIDRLARLPGAELILYQERDTFIDQNGQKRNKDSTRLLGALVYFPPDYIPAEIRPQAALQPFEAAFTQLLVVHPEMRGSGVTEMLLQAQAIHLQRTDAKGAFGSIPEGNFPSFGTHFKHGALLNHADQPVARRFDGSPVPKRGFTVLIDPCLRGLLAQDGPALRKERMRLLKESKSG